MGLVVGLLKKLEESDFLISFFSAPELLTGRLLGASGSGELLSVPTAAIPSGKEERLRLDVCTSVALPLDDNSDWIKDTGFLPRVMLSIELAGVRSLELVFPSPAAERVLNFNSCFHISFNWWYNVSRLIIDVKTCYTIFVL